MSILLTAAGERTRSLVQRPAGFIGAVFLCCCAAGAYGQSPPPLPEDSSNIGTGNGRNLQGSGAAGASYEDFLKRTFPPLPPGSPEPSPDPRNLEGTWLHHDLLERLNSKTMSGHPTPLNAEARKLLDRRIASANAGKPIANASTYCLPPGQMFQFEIHAPFTIFQTKDVIYFLFQEFHGVWKIRMNQEHDKNAPREYMGDSVGHWDGNTLVVDTMNYKEAFWIDSLGIQVSRDAHLVHRIRKIDEEGPGLEFIITFDDPAMFTSKWSLARTFGWRPNKAVFEEYNCEQQVGGPDGISGYGVIEER